MKKYYVKCWCDGLNPKLTTKSMVKSYFTSFSSRMEDSWFCGISSINRYLSNGDQVYILNNFNWTQIYSGSELIVDECEEFNCNVDKW